ncbi:unnamed protein product, partial [Amoebophrya sp. A25]
PGIRNRRTTYTSRCQSRKIQKLLQAQPPQQEQSQIQKTVKHLPTVPAFFKLTSPTLV